MNAWFALGIFLLGAGIGALVTAIAYAGRVRRVRAEVAMRYESQLKESKEEEKFGRHNRSA